MNIDRHYPLYGFLSRIFHKRGETLGRKPQWILGSLLTSKEKYFAIDYKTIRRLGDYRNKYFKDSSYQRHHLATQIGRINVTEGMCDFLTVIDFQVLIWKVTIFWSDTPCHLLKGQEIHRLLWDRWIYLDNDIAGTSCKLVYEIITCIVDLISTRFIKYKWIWIWVENKMKNSTILSWWEFKMCHCSWQILLLPPVGAKRVGFGIWVFNMEVYQSYKFHITEILGKNQQRWKRSFYI